MKIIFQNLPYKIASVVLACFFWYMVQGEEILEINRKINVNLRVADGYLIKEGNTHFKDATLSGARAVLADFSSGLIDANIAIPKGHQGVMRFRIDKEFIKDWNNRIKLVVHDAYLEVHVDEKYEKEIPIKENVVGLPASGYIVEKIQLEPKSVKIIGPRSEVKKISYLETEAIDISDFQKSQKMDVGLRLPSHLNQQTTVSTENISVAIQVGEKKLNKSFSSIPIELESKRQASVFPKYVKIEIQGTPGVLSFIRRSELRAFIDTKDLSVGRHVKRVQVKIPADTALIETFPEQATVEVFSDDKR